LFGSFSIPERAARLGLTALLGLALAACTHATSPTAGAPTPSAAIVTPTDISTNDVRLAPALLELANNPAWADGWTGPLTTGRARPSLRDLCVHVDRPGASPLFVTLDVERTPWAVRSVAIFDAGDIGPRVTYQRDADVEPDTCRGIVSATGEPFPDHPDGIPVNGPVSDVDRRAIQAAVFSGPAAFGLDRSSAPSLALYPSERTDPPGRTCYQAIVYQGGPVSKVLLGLTRDVDGARVASVRIAEQALRPAAAPVQGEC
jgi:hypothetical protein